PSLLTFKGVTVTLENNSVWKQFYNCGTEMILTKQGRRMFPYCRYRLTGLEPTRQYNLVLSIVPADQHRYRWNINKWEASGPAEHQTQGLIRAFSHHYSPCLGSDWMGGMVSFYKLKLTNNSHDQEGHIILHSMHRYIPRLHVIPVPDGGGPTPDQPVVKGPESMTFTFPQTEFIAVTTYQNLRITQLKINHNPFAKGFRDDGHNLRLNRIRQASHAAGKADAPPPDLNPAGPNTNSEEVVDLSTKKRAISASLSDEQEAETQAKLRKIAMKNKPVSNASPSKERMDVDNLESYHPHTESVRGKQAGCGVAFLHNGPPLEPKEENHDVNVTPKVPLYIKIQAPKRSPTTPTSLRSTPASSPGYHKKRKRINRRWGNSRGREAKAEAAATTVIYSPSLTVAMQPELDDVEGLLFVSFTSKEALGIHVGDKPANSSFPVSPVFLTPQSKLEQTVEEIPETDEEKIARLQAVLLQDLGGLKHRQVIHPVLQEVGLKLSSLDPAKAVDLRYLGVNLPLPSPVLPVQDDATVLSPVDEGLPFVSRTGKTSDMTKIKGWRDKFVRSKETSPSKCDGSQKDLSAFCSNMLDEYLETEAQRISERAATFSTNQEGSVAYQLPAKSSSYVKTLDSALKHRNATSKSLAWANRPCPLSHKPLLYSVLMSQAPPMARPAPSAQAGARPKPKHPNKSPVLTITAKSASGAKVTYEASPASQRSPPYNPGVGQKPVVSCGQSQGVTHNRIPGFSKFQHKLLEMEMGAVNQGLGRTHLTPERLSVALSVLLTAKMLPSQRLSVPQYKKAMGPECGQEFCRLGCVCSSLQRLNRGPLHCRRLDCMFGCACFKRKIIKQFGVGETENQIQPLYSVTNMEHEVQPCPGFHSDTLWDRSTALLDPEPVFAPKNAVLLPSQVAPSNKRSIPRLNQQVREEDKDPVYKYLESMMTCARVREFNSKPPPQVTMQSKSPAALTPRTTTRPQKTTNNLPKQNPSTILTIKNAAGKASLQAKSKETEPTKQVEIQSTCQWGKDRKMVLEGLCQRLKRDNLSPQFCVGPYLIRMVSKIYIKKASGSTITYKVHISKPKKTSDEDEEDESDDADEEEVADDSPDEDQEPVEEDSPTEEPELQVGVTPFLSGVLPAGKLRARKKPSGCQAVGLIQVNGKSYTQARLLLGNMGSLHPANRLAAYVTGRLQATTKIPHQNSQKPDSKFRTPGIRRLKTAGTIVPPVITARKTKAQKTPKVPPGQRVQPDLLRRGPGTFLHPSLKPSAINPLITFVSSHRGSVTPFWNSSSSSPVSLTVSPSLKTPSFLRESGTYSFRICPPSRQGSLGQNLPGVALPGGFTLIQLPKPGVDGAFVQPAETVNTTNTTGTAKPPPQKEVSFSFGSSADNSDVDGPGLASDHAHTGTKDLSSGRSDEPGSSPELICDENMPSDESDDAKKCKLMTRVESDLDIGSEDMSSDSSDYDGEGDEDVSDETVDIETVEETREGITISEMMAAASKTLLESRYSSEDSGSARELGVKHENNNGKDEYHNRKRRTNHKVLERLRRSEQRYLFNRLQSVLQSDPRAPKLRLLSLAQSEIRTLAETSKCLEEKKRRLTQMQSIYVKELSILSGKPKELIKMKLKEIYERQKLNERRQRMVPFSLFPRHQPKTSVPQATTHQPMLQPILLSQPKAPAPAEITVCQPRPKPQQVVSTLATAEITTSLSRVEGQPQAPVASVQVTDHQTKIKDQPETPGAPIQVTAPHSQMEDQFQAPSAPATPQVTAPQDGPQALPPSPISPTQVSTPQSNLLPQAAGCPPQPFTLPLIRSKTGRIILPSCLKPIGQGFYTLMLMGAKGEESEVSSSPQTLPSDLDSSQDQERISSESEQPSDNSEEGKNPESSRAAKEVNTPSPLAKKTTKSARRRGLTSPLVELARLNKSIYLPSVALQPVEKSMEGGRVLGLNKEMATACLSFNPLKSPPCAEPEPEPEPSPPVVRRGRGRPRKHPLPVTPVNQNTKTSLVQETKTQAEDSPGKVAEVKDTQIPIPVPVKRGRGRPPKKRPAQLASPAAGTGCEPKKAAPDSGSPATQAGSSPAKASQPVDSPVRLTRSLKSPDTKSKNSPSMAPQLGGINALRPVTRGALGKDFPSAKKRSWIDVEKELEME
ncbi:MAX gene-associated protein, partial [Centroberyx gerrardi]